ALVEQLKTQLAAQLPSYMQPSAYAVLPRLPLTPNGKVDKAALPQPALQPLLHVPAETPTERRLAAIWGEVLGLEQVSVTANFFDIGGHSLLATRLISAVRRQLEVEVSIRLIFDRSDIRSIARLIDEQEIRRRNQAMVMTREEHVELEW
ncbi:phosphopantetheine binding protein, partial [Tahibacter aquaticus]